MKEEIRKYFVKNLSTYTLRIENYYIRAVYKNIVISFYIAGQKGKMRCEIIDTSNSSKQLFNGRIRNLSDFTTISLAFER